MSVACAKYKKGSVREKTSTAIRLQAKSIKREVESLEKKYFFLFGRGILQALPVEVRPILYLLGFLYLIYHR